MFFFYNASKEVTQHARGLIERAYEEREGKPRTLLGMLSTWTTELAGLGVADMDWLEYKSPRAVTLDDQWVSTTGSGGSYQIKKAAKLAQKDLDGILSIMRKSDRHGLKFTAKLLESLKTHGYYGMIRPTRDRQCTMIREVAATLCDVCA